MQIKKNRLPFKKIVGFVAVLICMMIVAGCTSRKEEITNASENTDKQSESLTWDDTIKNVCELPDRASKLWLIVPQWLVIETPECTQTSLSGEWFDSVSLAYKGDYETAMAQAKIIADKANIQVSPEFAMAQESLSGLTNEEISQITSGSMLQWIVYSNAGLLTTNIEYLITISVDENGKLILEATNFEQMKK